MISFRHKGNLSKTTRYLERIKRGARLSMLDRYGRAGVAALASATPTDSGTTAASWYYEIEQSNGSYTLRFLNSNVNKYVNIAIILQYGHGTGTGGWVEGRDYINPAIQPIFDELAKEAWEEVAKV